MHQTRYYFHQENKHQTKFLGNKLHTLSLYAYNEHMTFIQNYNRLATSEEKRIFLDLIETAYNAIQPENAIASNIKLKEDILIIKDKQYNLSQFEHVYLLGFGKGSAGIAKKTEQTLAEKLTKGFVIDTNPEDFTKIEFTQGTHPLPSEGNYQFTQKITQELGSLTEKDLVLVVICGGGSAMLVQPVDGITLEEKINVNKALLKSGADIIEMNTVRKHLSTVKGGGLAKILYPATVASLIFSDVPGNDLSFIASGPTVKDTTTIEDAKAIIAKYHLQEQLEPILEHLTETPKDASFFEHVSNILMLSNVTALEAMQQHATEQGYTATIYSDSLQGDANEVGKQLLEAAKAGTILLVGGETTVHVTGQGEGGRNQQLVLAALPHLQPGDLIASFASDGWDNSAFAGALGSSDLLETAGKKGLNYKAYLQNNDAFHFFEAVETGLKTGRLASNVSDLMIVLKK